MSTSTDNELVILNVSKVGKSMTNIPTAVVNLQKILGESDHESKV